MTKIDDYIKKGKLKVAKISDEMIIKELEVGKKDLLAAISSFKLENYKWATIQAYYSIFHGVRALIFKAGYREESHIALKIAFKELYIDNKTLDKETYKTLESGMDLRELADYKETFSQGAAENLIKRVEKAIETIEEYIKN
jgi:uncharacterized protein (UPF0332 family)